MSMLRKSTSALGISLICCLSVLCACCALAPAALAAPNVLTTQANGEPYGSKEAVYAEADRIPAERTVTIVNEGGGFYHADYGNGMTSPNGPFAFAAQRAFEHVRLNGSEGTDLWRVVIPAGKHAMGEATGLYVYSNTVVDCRAEGVEIYAGKTNGQIIRAGNRFDARDKKIANPGGFDDYENIFVLGGTFYGHPEDKKPAEQATDESYTGMNLRFGHASNIYLAGVTVRDNVNGHHVELGAVDGCYIYDCTFTGAYGGNSSEAVQVDTTHREDTFSGYYPFDDLPVKNLVVRGCTFNDVVRGVGSHHFVLGADTSHDNIKIEYNTFTDIRDHTIEAGNFTNTVISNNTLTRVQSGIFAASVSEDHTYLKNDEEQGQPDSKTLEANIRITSNKIELASSGAPKMDGTRYGIRADGAEITSGKATYTENKVVDTDYSTESVTKKLPVGRYYLSNVTITGNTITGGIGGSGENEEIWGGIRAEYLLASTIENNKVSAGRNNIVVRHFSNIASVSNNTLDGISSGDDGIRVTNSATVASIADNIITNHGGYGIFVREASTVAAIKDNTIKDNTIKDPTKIGVFVYSGSNVPSIKGNTISNPGQHGVVVSEGSSASAIVGNTVTDANNYGVSVDGATGVAITDNTIAGTKEGTGVNVKNSANASVKSNTISSAGAHGVALDSSAGATVAGNTITGPASCGVSVAGSDNAVVNGANKIENAGSHGVRVENSKSAKVQNNTIASSTNNGVYLLGSQSASASGNTISGAGTYGVNVDNSKSASVASNTISGAKGTGINVKNSASAAVKSNKVSNAGAHGVSLDSSAGATVAGNTITSPASNGVNVLKSDNAVVNGTNKIEKAGISGVKVDTSKSAKVQNNTITSPTNNGIYLVGSQSASASGNTVSGAGTYGVFADGSKSAGITSNTISGAKGTGINVKNSASAAVKSNKVSNAGAHGVSLDSSAGATVAGNTITSPASNGVNVLKSANAIVNGANKISNAGISGIKVDSSNSAQVASNTVTGSKSNGIYLTATTGATVSKNTVIESTDQGIYLNKSPKTSVTGNTSTSTINKKTKYEILVGTGSTNCTVKNNKYGPRMEVAPQTAKLPKQIAIRVQDGTSPIAIATNTPLDWKRLAGAAAFDTMQQITTEFGTAKVAVVATNTSFKDSLAAAALAGSLSAPMLTTNKGSLATQTMNELNRMGTTTVYLVGSTNEVAKAVESQIKAKTGVKTVTRVDGKTASQRAVACAKLVKGRSDTVIIATQNSFKDALSISPYAYASKSPILYAEGNKKLSAATVDYIKSGKFKKAIVVGGPVALPEAVIDQLKKAGISASGITRLAGSNQYKTSRVIAEWAMGQLANGTGGGSGYYQYASITFQPNLKLSANALGVACGENYYDGKNDIGWKDALAGAALCGANKSILLLCDDNKDKNGKAKAFSASGVHAQTVIKNNKGKVTFGYVFGGRGAVSQDVMDRLVKASK